MMNKDAIQTEIQNAPSAPSDSSGPAPAQTSIAEAPQHTPKKYVLADLPELRSKVTDHKRELVTLHQQKEKAFTERKKIDTQIAGLVQALNTAKQKRDHLTKEVKERKAERGKVSKEIRGKVGEVKKLSQEREQLLAKHRVRGNPEALKAEIASLDYKIETQGLPFSKEQELMKIIKEKKKQLAQFSELRAVFDRVREIDTELRAMRDKVGDAHRAVQEKAGASQHEHEELVKDARLLRDLRMQRKKFNSECTALKDRFTKGTAELQELLKTLQELGGKVEEEHKKERQHREHEQKLSLAQRGKLIEEKLRKGGKLTTQDLLILQGSRG